jgi:transcriptional antiterminator RfaH
MGVDQPIQVTPGVVEALIARYRNSEMTELSELRTGDTVRMILVPFADSLCRIERLDDRSRVRVLIELMGGQVVAQANRTLLGPAIACEPIRNIRAGVGL